MANQRPTSKCPLTSPINVKGLSGEKVGFKRSGFTAKETVNCIGGVGLARARRPFPKLPELQDEVTAAVVMDTRQWVGLAVILSRLTDYKNPLQSLKSRPITNNQTLITPSFIA
ncbi:hypothetical protein PSTT_09129 [Puccinia striiformis]|uniref:Uncharacterized protein n=1 Tax=Puccinia striiformis TaxID=27350 RepID=A0A2S4V9S3_9BASI|nr:hypothetical protein PSTT_09129 [Puccinia striiformis]